MGIIMKIIALQIALQIAALCTVITALVIAFGVLSTVIAFSIWFVAKTYLNYLEAEALRRTEWIRSQLLSTLR